MMEHFTKLMREGHQGMIKKNPKVLEIFESMAHCPDTDWAESFDTCVQLESNDGKKYGVWYIFFSLRGRFSLSSGKGEQFGRVEITR